MSATLRDAALYFGDYDRCHNFLVRLRWLRGKVKCPACGGTNVGYLETGRVWKCYARHPKPRFSLKTGTIFEDSAVGLEKWLPVAWTLFCEDEALSSHELHRVLGVTQKTAWFMLHRLRLAMRSLELTATRKSSATSGPFESSRQFRRFRAGMRQLLTVPKSDLDRRVQEAKLNSDRIYSPKPPGRKRST